MKKNVLFLLLSISINTISVFAQHGTADWMCTIADNTPLSGLLIPGTHDSGAYVRGGGLVVTQDLNFKEQLNAGIRAFDIRLVAEDTRLIIYHGIISQNLNFADEVMPVFINFLKSHPTETIVLTFRKEGDDVNSSRGYGGLLHDVLSASANAPKIVPAFRYDLTIGETRGKILCLHRDEISGGLIGGRIPYWEDNAIFQSPIISPISGKNAYVSIEDVYSVPTVGYINDKKGKVSMQLNRSAGAADIYKWYITFTSGSGWGAWPGTIASYLLPHTNQHIAQMDLLPRGIVFMDFAGDGYARELTQTIINANKRYQPDNFAPENRKQPLISDNENEYWYQLIFRKGYAAIEDTGDNQKLMTRLPEAGKPAQLWKITAAQNGYILTNKLGRKFHFSNDRFTASSNQNTTFNFTQTQNTDYANAWELQRTNTSGNSVNQCTGAGNNKEICEWEAGDENNPLLFVLATTANAFAYSNNKNEIWFITRSSNGKYVYVDSDEILKYTEKYLPENENYWFKFQKKGNFLEIYNKKNPDKPVAANSVVKVSINGTATDWQLVTAGSYPLFSCIRSTINNQYLNPMLGLSEGDMGFYEEDQTDFGNQWTFDVVKKNTYLQTSIQKAKREKAKVEISVKNGYIITENTPLNVITIYNTSGQVINPNQKLASGVYIIQIKGEKEFFKIAIK